MIGNMTVYTGGVPAKYGDFTGGVVVIESKSYSDYVIEKRIRSRMAQAYFNEKEKEKKEKDSKEIKEEPTSCS